MIKTLRDFCLIHIEDRFQRKTGVKGIGGMELEVGIDEKDDYFANSEVKTSGVVIAIPDCLSRVPIAQETQGTPSYISHGSYKYKYRSDIVMEVKVGDKIYFHHNTLFSEDGMKNLVAKNTYKVSYDSIQCAVRERGSRVVKDENGPYDHETYSDIIMIGSYCLIRPDMETWEDITIPTFETANGVPLVNGSGEKILRPKEKWLQTKVEPQAKHLQGFVVAVGTPLKGDLAELAFNDGIWYRKHADWEVEIEGQKYYMIRQRNIIAKKVKICVKKT